MTERERLIELLNDKNRPWHYLLCAANIRSLAVHLLANGVIVPPCKVGDTVYTNIAMQGWYFRNKDKPYSGKVVFIGLNDSKKMGYGFINVLYNGRNGCVYQFNFSDIGKTVFLSKEEAEKALEDMKK